MSKFMHLTAAALLAAIAAASLVGLATAAPQDASAAADPCPKTTCFVAFF